MPASGSKSAVPYNELIEKTVICCMLNNPETIDEGMVLISEDYFYSRKCKFIFHAIRELYFEKDNIDIITVRNRLLKKTDEELRDANITDKSQINVEYFSDITNIPAVPQSMKKYCEDLKEVYVRRKLKSYSEGLILESVKGEQDVYDVLLNAQRDLFQLSKQDGEKDFLYLKQLLPNVIDRMNEAANMKGGITGVTSGFKSLDSYTQGFQKQDLIIIAARPGAGKTSLALNVAYKMAKADKKVAFFSLEMGGESLAQRLLAMESVITSEKLRSGRLSDAEWDRALDAAKEINTPNIAISDNSFLTIAELQNKCRKLKSEDKLDCVMIDYLQLMHAGKDGYNGRNDYSKAFSNRQEEVAEISRSLKGLAKELDIPVIALAQLHRASDDKKEYSLSDIRESGQIEQDADLIIFIDKKKYIDPNASPEEKNSDEYQSDTVFLKIMKHRNGRTGDIQLRFDKATTKFFDLDKFK